MGTLTAEVNTARDVLALLRAGQPRTKSELATILGQARSTVSGKLDILTELGLVEQVGLASSTGGRPSTLFTFRRDAGLVLAAELGASHAELAITDLAGTVLAHEQFEMVITDGPELILKLVAAGWQALLEREGLAAAQVVGAGLGLPGPVEHSTGLPVSPPIMPGWDGYDVVGKVRETFDVPVFVDNEANLLALGEWTMHCPEETDMLVVKIATGIGAGIVSNGKLMRGARGVAGDIGHITAMGGEERLCRCGQVGCVEAIASGRGIAQTLRSEGIDAHTSADVVALVRAGDPHAIRATRDAGRVLGEVLSACVATVNPNQILIGGEMSQAGETLLAGIRETVYRRAQPLSTRVLSIDTMKNTELGGVVGAAYMVLDAVLS